MHIISASRRTDIPAFHAQWLVNRIRAGRVRVRRPFGGGYSEVSLAPDDVIAIVFWTKNAAPLLPYLDELDRRGYALTFLYPINNDPTTIEPRVPGPAQTLSVLRDLSQRFPRAKVRWRYDTIVLADGLDRKWHTENFDALSGHLAPYSAECIFSFCDYYKKTMRTMDRLAPGYHRPSEAQCNDLAQELAEIAHRRGIVLASCAHDFLVQGRVKKARCIDPTFLLEIVQDSERREALQTLKRSPTRKQCDCAASKDIGAYDTCVHGCVYCYANSDPERARNNLMRISPDDECLDPSCPR
jgi:hypothetical protein